jgi:hypothetical protein
MCPIGETLKEVSFKRMDDNEKKNTGMLINVNLVELKLIYFN